MIALCYYQLGWTALHIAAHRGYSEMAIALIDGGADVNVVDGYGN